MSHVSYRRELLAGISLRRAPEPVMQCKILHPPYQKILRDTTLAMGYILLSFIIHPLPVGMKRPF